MIHATDTAFNERPKSLDAVRVDVAHDVDASAVIDPLVRVAPFALQCVVPRSGIRVDRSAWQDVLVNLRDHRFGLNVVGDEGDNRAVPLDHSKDRFLIVETPRLALAFATEVGFINFYRSVQLPLF